MKETQIKNWDDFYKWLEIKGYHLIYNNNIFRHTKFITSFDAMEDDDSGEIEETIERIKQNDIFNF